MASRHIAIVGAGLAGLAAATRLRALGCEVTLLERAERVGGRATSDRRDGFEFDAGAQLVGARDRALLELAEAVGGGPSPLRPVALAQVHGGSIESIDPTGLRGIARIAGVRWLDALRLLRLERILERFAGILDPARPELGARLDDRSVADFTRLYFGRSALDHFVAPWLSSATLADEAQASRLSFLLLLVSRRYVTEGTLRMGLGRFAESLASGVKTRVGSEVDHVEERVGGLALVDALGEAVEADAVVVATRASAALRITEKLLTTPERRFLNGVRYASAIVLHAALERPLVRKATRVRVPRREGGPVEAVAFEPAGAGGRAPESRGTAALVAREAWSRVHLEAPDEAVEKELLAALEGLAPGASRGVLFAQLRRHREAYPRFDVGRYRALASFRRVVADRRAAGRRLYFAGDHLVAPTLEGAVVSGLRAADEVAADLGISATQSRSRAMVRPSPPRSGSPAAKSST